MNRQNLIAFALAMLIVCGAYWIQASIDDSGAECLDRGRNPILCAAEGR